jgi:hypothetical protein
VLIVDSPDRARAGARRLRCFVDAVVVVLVVVAVFQQAEIDPHLAHSAGHGLDASSYSTTLVCVEVLRAL